MRLALLLLLLALLPGEDAPPPIAWAVVQTTDHAGAQTAALVGLSQASAAAPEVKALQQAATEAWNQARAGWEERRRAYEADRANNGRSFRRVEPEPARPAVKVAGQPLKDRGAAEDLLARIQRELLAKRDPGAARRARVMEEQLLQHFTIGIQATPEWIIETRQQQGARWACMAGYLSHVVNTPGDVEGKDTWFFKYGALRAKFAGARAAKVICWNTWYGLAEAPPARYQPSPAAATPVNARVQSTMIAYWSLVKKFLQMAAEFEDVDCVLQVEPDEWGHLLIPNGFDVGKEGVVLVGGSGMPELRGIPDSVKGFAAAFRLLRDTYAPHVLLAANPSAWDRNGKMSGERWGAYFNAMDVNRKNGWDLFITQLHDWDRGQARNGSKAVYPPYAEADTVMYHGSIDNWCAWIKPIHDATGMWGVAWQLPQGNATYATCDGSDGHAMDGVAELLLDGHPANRVAARMAAAGCCMWIFSLGGAGANVTDAKKDGITNPKPHPGSKGLQSLFPDDDGGYLRLKGGDYFKRPQPILARPAAAARPAQAKPAPPPPAPARAAPALRDGALAAAWDGRLRRAVQDELRAGREPRFALPALPAEATLRGLDADGGMAVSVAGAGEMALRWQQLAARDRAAIAAAIADARRGDQALHALAAFHLLLAGDEAAGRERLQLAGPAADEVADAFALRR